MSKLEETSRLPSHVLEQENEMYEATTHDGAWLKPRALEAMSIQRYPCQFRLHLLGSVGPRVQSPKSS